MMDIAYTVCIQGVSSKHLFQNWLQDLPRSTSFGTFQTSGYTEAS